MKGMPWAKYSVGIHAHGLRLVAFLVSDILFSMFPELRVRTVACGVGYGLVYWCWVVSVIVPPVRALCAVSVWLYERRLYCCRPLADYFIVCVVLSFAAFDSLFI